VVSEDLMEALVGAVVLAWLALIVLAFAMAGLLRQLRDVQAGLARPVAQVPGQPPVLREIPASVRPRGASAYSVVLLVDENCPICAEVAPVFAQLAAAGSAALTFVVLGRSRSERYERDERVEYVADAGGYHRLDPGWRPAIVVVDRQARTVVAEPAGSEEAVRAVIAEIASKTAKITSLESGPPEPTPAESTPAGSTPSDSPSS
jgi:hypothetical protein